MNLSHPQLGESLFHQYRPWQAALSYRLSLEELSHRWPGASSYRPQLEESSFHPWREELSYRPWQAA